MTKQKLPKDSIEIWRIYGWIELTVYLLVVLILLVISFIWDWPLWICSSLFLLCLIFIPVRIKIFPPLRWKYFHYEITDEEIDIQDGMFVIERTLVPIIKIQKVSVSQGPILKKYGVANVTIFNSTSEVTIPFLPYEEALELRGFISKLVKEMGENE